MQSVDASTDSVLVGTVRFFEGESVNGLNGGNRDNGGASNVDNNSLGNANENLAVRLVLECN